MSRLAIALGVLYAFLATASRADQLGCQVWLNVTASDQQQADNGLPRFMWAAAQTLEYGAESRRHSASAAAACPNSAV